ncbi:capsular exopolysaccharide biosynthesis protein [Carboxydocella sp. ULO1]|nr:capsular exopolysaccharide biosynthesis protein [Carboxydocella sp. ULO1]
MMERLIVDKEPKSPLAEAYRRLRTNIQYANVAHELKTILFTSAGPGEGKSSVAANYAALVAQQKKEVILVDCDLRRPSLHRVFDLKNSRGLTNVMTHDFELKDVLQTTSVPGLRVLTSGPIPPNPVELLAAEEMDNIMGRLMEMADLVVIDTPPIQAVTDALVLAPKVDGVVLVLMAAAVSRQQARLAKEGIQRVGGRLLGAVLNGVEMKKGSYYYYNYHYSYGVSE